jgi:hypothetical protein
MDWNPAGLHAINIVLLNAVCRLGVDKEQMLRDMREAQRQVIVSGFPENGWIDRTIAMLEDRADVRPIPPWQPAVVPTKDDGR